MARFSITRSLPGDDAWSELIEHPELLFGHFAPELRLGQTFASIGHTGAAQGRIELVQQPTLVFAWGWAGWPQPATITLTVAGDFTVEAEGIPDDDLAAVQTHWEQLVDGAVRYLASVGDQSDGTVAAVLFDADGVLQSPAEGWLDEFVRLGGDGFVGEAFTAELECLAGENDLAPKLQAILQASGAPGTVDQVLAAWNNIVVDDEALAVVARVRASGRIVGLATNQQSYRGAQMSQVLNLDQHFDHVFYSYRVGAAKPHRAYFESVLADLRLPAGEVAFIDDAPANVVGARAVGLRAALHRPSSGAAGLAADLIGLGIEV